MAIYYSDTIKGFYHDDLSSGTPPSDAIEITNEQWKNLINGVNTYKQKIELVDGMPTLVGDPYIFDPTVVLPFNIRLDRDYLLQQCDWTQQPDVPEVTRNKWKDYRQALRDVPQQSGFPNTIVWPVKPT
jgi:hypothetical protein